MMRERVTPFSWASAGALAGFGLIALMIIGAPFLPAGVVLALAGLIFLRTRGLWSFFVGFGGLPARSSSCCTYPTASGRR